MPARGIVSLAAGALPSHLAAPFDAGDGDWNIDWGEPEPFNTRTWRHRVFSDEVKKRTLRYDSLGRVIRGANRL